MSCAHINSKPTRRTISSGRVITFLQCQDCGGGRAGKMKEFPDVETLPEYDETISDRYYKQKEEEREEQRKAFEKERTEKKSEWWVKYNEYLESAHWEEIRYIVLERDPKCLCCLQKMSSQAHHLDYSNYNRYGITFPVDCIGVCEGCHGLIHGKQVKPDEYIY